MKKQRRIAVSCTTLEALKNCIADHCSVICIEAPLYFQASGLWDTVAGIEDYSVTEYASIDCIMLIKIHGPNAFDSTRYDIYYYPLHGLLDQAK